MKKIFLVLLLVSLSFCMNGQTLGSDSCITKFKRYYEENAADSIYLIFSPQMKAALTKEKTKSMVLSIRTQLGSIVSSNYSDSAGDKIFRYRLVFERPLVEFVLAVQNGVIIGMFQKQVESLKNDPVEIESPDNISIQNPYGKVNGTLLLPQRVGQTKVPVVLMIAGSGPTDRNMNQGNMFRSDSFYMLAKELAANGIASVRYDKRGVGKSTTSGKFLSMVLGDFISDASSFVKLLKADPRFSKVIVLGHSEGSTIGLFSAAQEKPAAFISVSGPGNDFGTILRKQLKAVMAEADFKLAAEILDSLKKGKQVQRELSPALVNLFSADLQPFLISSIKYNPSKEMRKLNIPTLIISGTTDLQVSREEANLLSKANPKAKLAVISDMNHTLKEAPADRDLNLKTYNDPKLPLHKELIPILVKFCQLQQ